MDRALLTISQQQKRLDRYLEVDVGKDYPLIFARDGEEFGYVLEMLAKRGWLEPPEDATFGDPPHSYRLTPEGWQAVEQLRRTQRDSDQAFVAMWFDPNLNQAWEEGFKPALEATGFTPLRVDSLEYNGKIDDRIVAEIRRSGLLVADFTGNRGGVYFEAGFARGLGMPVIHTCRDTHIDAVHLDTRQYNHIVWANPEDLKQKLINRIEATIPGRALP